MDLPFAIDLPAASLEKSDASLVIASSQEGLLESEQSDLYGHHSSRTGLDSVIEHDIEVVDFTQYVNVTETDATEVEVLVNQGVLIGEETNPEPKGDVLALLMSGDAQNGELVVSQCEEANDAAHKASYAKKNGDLASALQNHSLAAKLFRDAAIAANEKDLSLSNSLLILSQSQAKSALALKKFISLQESNAVISSALTRKERLRATVRGALVKHKEADISDSIFLGKATKQPDKGTPEDSTMSNEINSVNEAVSPPSDQSESSQNPVDEMLKLERELKELDSALELGNSVVSLGTRTQNRLKNSTMDGSFMVVPPGSSYMSSSAMWSRPNHPRAKANRVQNILEAATVAPPSPSSQSTATIIAPAPPQRINSNNNLDASWWGNASLAGSVVSMAASSRPQQDPNNTKQMMRLLDSIKTLSDENATLLREVEEAEAARLEAKASKEQMKRFKSEYGKRFSALKSALENFRKTYSQNKDNSENPISSSEYLKSDLAHSDLDDQIASQSQQIRKLAADLKKEKEESKKKDAALRKYESFYKEVKARSAEKARQRQAQQQQRRRVPASHGKV
mmetsp:Transcript_23225/g.35220  ORF Transcript_23225/g.35220 Transcript_23225/m.35220 type:complete len:570 (+) Transcript_23225:146-1855(+)|eukprot:CAMPEP_0194219718 /NCGR_PEP_ID=MMETSP0156-20130528/26667_1 /TAXON_ID=33649 /ORGANISM="Thalassionema nitzschioides, Strain L26-B" /LENGTH=569 /DNA_ID=CAMNT_0038949499 /DNA_START=109 /DNA_END=1818 /DNA_ORIENTATION=+